MRSSWSSPGRCSHSRPCGSWLPCRCSPARGRRQSGSRCATAASRSHWPGSRPMPALAAIVIAGASVVAALGLRAFLRVLNELAGPAVGDVRALVATIRTEAEGLAGTSRELRQRIVNAADAAEARLAELDAVFEVVQEEVEATVLDVAATMRTVRRGISLLEWGRRTLKRGKKH